VSLPFDLRYPAGKFEYSVTLSNQQRNDAIAQIEAFPAQLRQVTSQMSNAQLDTPYRPGGWTSRQVVHHVADSHMHAYTRMKFAATSDRAQILPYPEEIWAELDDARIGAIESSLSILEGLHVRWVQFLRALSEASWQQSYVHPEQGPVPLVKATALYSWHCRHHLGHVRLLASSAIRERG
jgi:hypothetical protein